METRCRKFLLPHMMLRRGLPCWRPRLLGPMRHSVPASSHDIVMVLGLLFFKKAGRPRLRGRQQGVVEHRLLPPQPSF